MNLDCRWCRTSIPRKRRGNHNNNNDYRYQLFSCRSAFFLFCADHRGDLKTKNPTWSVGEIAKELGKQWSSAAEDIKRKYAERGDAEKEKYYKVSDMRDSSNVMSSISAYFIASGPKNQTQFFN